MTSRDKWRQIQAVLGTSQDGIPGPNDWEAISALRSAALHEYEDRAVHHVKASSFADPKDVAAFRHCKALGGTDYECFKVGDNGIGVWGDDTTVDVPMCALPPEDWQRFCAAARGKEVRVTVDSVSVVCELRDTMPHKAAIKNGAGIDLNPAACSALGLTPPILVPATWQWV